MSGGRPLARLRARLVEPRHPLLAVEVRPRAVALVRLAHDGGRLSLAASGCLELAEGALEVSPAEPNVRQPEALRAAIDGLLTRAGGAHGGEVALVLPDPVARLAILPAAELRGADVEELIRFRLRRSVPFEIRDARVAHLQLPARPGSEPMALVAAIYRPVLDGYEAAVRDVGLLPGLVELSGLALLRAASLDAEAGDELLVNWDHGYLSLLLSRGGQLALVRTLQGELAGRPEEVAREVANTVLYYRERLAGTGLRRVLVRSAARPPAEALALLRDPLGLEPEALDPWCGAPGAEKAGPAAAVAGAAASVLARAA